MHCPRCGNPKDKVWELKTFVRVTKVMDSEERRVLKYWVCPSCDFAFSIRVPVQWKETPKQKDGGL